MTPRVAPKRRSPGSGSFWQRKDGRWCGALMLSDGRRQVVYGRSRLEAESKLADAKRRDDQGYDAPDGRTTLDDLLGAWLEQKRTTVRHSTWATYKGHLDRYVIGSRVGRIRLAGLRAEDLHNLYGELLASGLSPTTVRHVHVNLHSALASAVQTGQVARNVADYAHPPAMRHEAMTVLTREQAAKLLQAARDDELEALFVLAVTTGMRLGELCGLRWRSVDLDRRALSVERSLTVHGQGATLTEPKSSASRRRVSLPVIAVDALRRHREVTQTRTASSDPEFRDLVFTRAKGRPLDPRSLTTKRFGALLERAGLPHIRFHDLRHTAATLLLGEGESPKVVSSMLGHASIGITLDLYSHVSDAMTDRASATMDRLFS